jgi:dihydropyrimidinase
VLAEGADADVVVWDPSRVATITAEMTNDGLGWTPYGGMQVPGTLRYVLARGDRMVDDGRFTGAGHQGRYLPVTRS